MRVARPAILRGDGAALIPLTRGLFTVVDEEWAWLSKWLWSVSDDGGRGLYAIRWAPIIEGPRAMIRMHRIILDLQDPKTGINHGEPGLEVDHINGDGLDNRRANLRSSIHAQNALNRRLGLATKTGYKGVNLYRNRFRALLWSKDHRRYLGSHTTAIDAARAYDAAAVAHFGIFARLNLPDEAPGPCPCRGCRTRPGRV